MLISRVNKVFKLLKATKSQKINKHNMSGHAFVYRASIPPQSSALYIGDFGGALMWWWIFWHFFHEYQHVIGEFEYPDPFLWTDEELGIPEKPRKSSSK